jgi:DNA-binding winged helix-turn-helix (wHTH) protein
LVKNSFSFDKFVLDVENRLLLADGIPVELSGRYLDALALLVAKPGQLVTKDRFMDEVWRGVPVTDEALTQCIKTLRRTLGDDAARPIFIETVPKHGYRFIAALDGGKLDSIPGSRRPAAAFDWRQFFLLGGAGVTGGGIAGLLGGITYGFAGAAAPLEPGMGAGSIVLVLTALTVLVALIGAAGVSFGMAAGVMRDDWRLTIIGGALGGMVVGGAVKLLGLDAFNLLLGQSPGNVTGALEGIIIGATVGLGVTLADRGGPIRIWPAALAGLGVGAIIPALGGKLLGGSLAQLAGVFPQSRFRLDEIGALFGESGFGKISQTVCGAIEIMLFAACMAMAMSIAKRQLTAS